MPTVFDLEGIAECPLCTRCRRCMVRANFENVEKNAVSSQRERRNSFEASINERGKFARSAQVSDHLEKSGIPGRGLDAVRKWKATQRDAKKRPCSRESRPSGFRNRSRRKTARTRRKRSIAGVFGANGRAKTLRIGERSPSELRSKRESARFGRNSTISERGPDEFGARYVVTNRPQSRASAAISRREAIRRRSSRPKAGAAIASKMAASLLVQQTS